MAESAGLRKMTAQDNPAYKMLHRSRAVLRALLYRRIVIEYDRVPFVFRQVPLKKVLNWLKVETSIAFRPEKPWGWPTHLQFEPSALCNLRCAFCPVTTGMQRSKGYMGLETFQRLIDEIGDYLFFTILWDWGEPFLNPDIFDMIAYAKQRQIKVISSTNGHLFAEPAMAQKLVESGIDSIVFAVDGINQETYQRYRVNGDLSKVLQGVRETVSAKRRHGLENPLIHFRFVAMRHNESEIPGLKEFAGKLGVDVMSIKTLNPFDQGECHSTLVDGLEYIPRNPRYQRFAFDSQSAGRRIRLERNPCKRLWNNPTVHWDGTVVPCCFDPHEHHALGALAGQPFGKIWFGENARTIRRQFKRDDQTLRLCADCTYAFQGGSCATETIAEVNFYKQSSDPRTI